MKPVDQLSDDEFTQRVQQALRALPDAPPAWQSAAIGLWPQATPAPQGLARVQAAIGALRATLSFDSWARPALATGMRSGRSPSRHLLYSAQGHDLDLRITAAAEHHVISGQILGPDEAGRITLVPLAGTGGEPREVALDALGEFRIADVAAGRYALRLALADGAIVIEPLDVGEPAA